MPFGHRCEYADFEACMQAHRRNGHNEESARRICGALQRDTEERCRQQQRRRDDNAG